MGPFPWLPFQVPSFPKRSPGSNVRPFSGRPACRSNHPAARRTHSLSLAHLAPCALGYGVQCLEPFEGPCKVARPSPFIKTRGQSRGAAFYFRPNCPSRPLRPPPRVSEADFSPHGFERAESRRDRESICLDPFFQGTTSTGVPFLFSPAAASFHLNLER